MQHLPHHKLSFNEFTLDLTRGSLFRRDEEIKLRPKSFEALRYLVENSGRLISKNELINAVWPDTSVTDDSLVQCMIEIRRALGEEGQQIVKTVPRRGYIFQAQVTENGFIERDFIRTDDVEPSPKSTLALPDSSRQPWLRSPAKVVTLALVTISLFGLGVWLSRRNQRKAAPTSVRSLVVLPFKSQIPSAQHDYLGLGVANEIITKLSQTGALIVRPTSAIRKYINQEVDALAAGREQQVDAVLDGTYLRVGDKLRISVNLLSVSDGSSLWAETFDQNFTDIFTIQDRVSQQVTRSLWLRLGPTEQERLAKRHTSNPQAYSYYVKAMYHFYNIGPNLASRSEADLAVDLFNKAIELDPEYALAHAYLGYAYTKIAVFQEDNPGLIEQAKKELGIAEGIDPELAAVHVARYFILFSQYEGWSVDSAIRELRKARELDPNAGHPEFADLYAHIGLEQKSSEEYELALNVDPNSDEIKNGYVNSFFISARPDEALEANRRLFDQGPDLHYFVEKQMVAEAKPLARRQYEIDRSTVWKFVYQVLLLAVQGKHAEAQAAVPTILAKERRYRGYHHDTYNIARIYALGGNSAEALKWLRVTVNEGFPHYPLFARDRFLDRIRDKPEFKQFMVEMKTRWESHKRAFGE